MPEDISYPPASRHNSSKNSTESIWLIEAFGNSGGETALWVAVITQAMMDALSRCKKSESIYQKHEAINWLTSSSKDFIDVCLCAALNPDYVRRKAKKIITTPKPWRAGPGKGKRYQERKKYREKQRIKATPPRNIEDTQAEIINLPILKK